MRKSIATLLRTNLFGFEQWNGYWFTSQPHPTREHELQKIHGMNAP
jgi:hypothetical protein